jgi:hypothetical protein
VFGLSSAHLPETLPPVESGVNVFWVELLSEEIAPGVTQKYRLTGDIQLTAAPIPVAVWLFGSALAGLGWHP